MLWVNTEEEADGDAGALKKIEEASLDFAGSLGCEGVYPRVSPPVTSTQRSYSRSSFPALPTLFAVGPSSAGPKKGDVSAIWNVNLPVDHDFRC